MPIHVQTSTVNIRQPSPHHAAPRLRRRRAPRRVRRSAESGSLAASEETAWTWASPLLLEDVSAPVRSRTYRLHADAWRSRSSSATTASDSSCVAARTTGGATPASSASRQRPTHRHQRSPGAQARKSRFQVVAWTGRCRPASRTRGTRSSSPRRRCACPCRPWPVSQQPLRKKPVTGECAARRERAALDVLCIVAGRGHGNTAARGRPLVLREMAMRSV